MLYLMVPLPEHTYKRVSDGSREATGVHPLDVQLHPHAAFVEADDPGQALEKLAAESGLYVAGTTLWTAIEANKVAATVTASNPDAAAAGSSAPAGDAGTGVPGGSNAGAVSG